MHQQGDRAPTLVPAPRSWLAIDVDGVDPPPLTDPACDLADAGEYVLGLLGLEACDAAIQATSSCGVKPGIRLRLWLLLDRPTDDDELRRWALATNRELGRKSGRPGVVLARADSLHGPTRASSTAWQTRCRSGLSCTTDTSGSPTSKSRHRRSSHLTGVCGGVEVSDDERLAAVGGELGFHAPLKSLVAAAVARHGSALNHAQLKGQVRQHLAGLSEAAWGGRGSGERERYASDRFLDDLLLWASARDQERVERVQALAHRLGVGR